jgi:signal transduction histidine kinase
LVLEYLRRLLDADALAPHGICLSWRPELLWTHVIADALIAAAYFSIPVALAVFVTRRRDLAFSWLIVLFAIFITACGTTHLFAIWTLWNPDYGPEAVVKLLTAIASVGTAIVMWPLIPQALALPSPAQLTRANEALTARVLERDAALAALQRETAEREAVEADLRQAQKMQAVGALTGGVAHDFNNLLTVIIGNLDRASRMAPQGDPQLRRALVHALEGAERAAVLTSQLLAFARKQPLMPQSLALAEVIGGLSPLMAKSIGESITVAVDHADPGVRVLADRNQFENALINLAVNARDAMPQGGSLSVATRRRSVVFGEFAGVQPGDYVEVRVTDTGCGMPEEVRQRAFEPFYTTKDVGRGTGLGLSQVYGFVTQSNGHVAIDSAPGQGTAVTILLPEAQA